ncbi:hypothetical protein FB459_2874 [Yimella lutea]|uniref:Uncharacterized protein n=1 Tax=Yimella lutea TaxID=587872 RepID=A0A542EJ14_9MICO|nr:hypothetical protein [Yimella lutea]TQJ15328.1 hypothetical protein FB459_2874 [Yimella lutea]
MILSATALLDRTQRRRCHMESPQAERTICGRPVVATGTVLTGRRTVINCPDCWAAMAFVTGH